MLDVTVRIDLSQAQRILNSIEKGLGDRALRSAVNKAAAQAKTRMSEAIRQDYNISAALVRERLRVRNAIRGSTVTVSAFLVGNPETGGGKRSMNLVHFLEKDAGVKAYRRGMAGRLDQLRFKVKRVGGKQILRGAFLGNRGRTVFIRTGSTRLPIKAVRTIGVPQMFSTKRNQRVVQDWIRANLPRIATSEISHYLATVK